MFGDLVDFGDEAGADDADHALELLVLLELYLALLFLLGLLLGLF